MLPFTWANSTCIIRIVKCVSFHSARRLVVSFFLFYAEVEFPCKIPAEPVSWFFRACDLSLQLLVLGKRFHPSNTTRHDGSLPSRDEVDDAGRGIFSLVLCSTRAQIIMREVKNFPANSLRYLYIMQIASSTILRNWRKEKSRGIATWRCILRSRNSFEDNCWLPPLYSGAVICLSHLTVTFWWDPIGIHFCL